MGGRPGPESGARGRAAIDCPRPTFDRSGGRVRAQLVTSAAAAMMIAGMCALGFFVCAAELGNGSDVTVARRKIYYYGYAPFVRLIVDVEWPLSGFLLLWCGTTLTDVFNEARIFAYFSTKILLCVYSLK